MYTIVDTGVTSQGVYRKETILYTNNVCVHTSKRCALRTLRPGAIFFWERWSCCTQLCTKLNYTIVYNIDVHNWQQWVYINMSVHTRIPPVGLVWVGSWSQPPIGHGPHLLLSRYTGVFGNENRNLLDRSELLHIPFERIEGCPFEIVAFGGGVAIRSWVLIVVVKYLGGIDIFR